MKKMLINASQQEEVRVALIEDNRLYDLDIEPASREQKKANVYKAKISRVEPSLNAVFVDYGAQRHGFLPLKELSPEYFQKNVSLEEAKADIKSLIKEGQELIIQVEKEERGNKGAALSTYVSLAGCYLVLMPNNPESGGISRRIDGEDRQQLKKALKNLVIPEGMSVIIRTAGIGRSQEELQWDLDVLLNVWRSITQVSEAQPAPFLIYQESNVMLRAIRDYLRDDIAEIHVDTQDAYNHMHKHLQMLRPEFLERLKMYKGDVPLFTNYHLESQIETAYQREVKLPSGGSIVIDQTEALVSIDINSAKATGGGDIEETARQTNIEAAEEIARQLRLRDMGGLVVIDFIDMLANKNQREVEQRLALALKKDRARVQTGRISRFGLLEMSRQRLRPSLAESSTIVCPRCNGRGTIRGIESLALSILRVIEEEATRSSNQEIQIHLPVNVATYLLNEKRNIISQFEKENAFKVVLVANPDLVTPHYEVKRMKLKATGEVKSYELKSSLSSQEDVFVTPEVTNYEQPALKSIEVSQAPKSSKKKGMLSWFWDQLFSSDDAEVITAQPEKKGKKQAPKRGQRQENSKPQGKKSGSGQRRQGQKPATAEKKPQNINKKQQLQKDNKKKSQVIANTPLEKAKPEAKKQDKKPTKAPQKATKQVEKTQPAAKAQKVDNKKLADKKQVSMPQPEKPKIKTLKKEDLISPMVLEVLKKAASLSADAAVMVESTITSKIEPKLKVSKTSVPASKTPAKVISLAESKENLTQVETKKTAATAAKKPRKKPAQPKKAKATTAKASADKVKKVETETDHSVEQE